MRFNHGEHASSRTRAALIQNKVIHDAEHVLGEPMDVLNDEEGKLQARRYKIMTDNEGKEKKISQVLTSVRLLVE